MTPGRFRVLNENDESVDEMEPRKCRKDAERSKVKPENGYCAK